MGEYERRVVVGEWVLEDVEAGAVPTLSKRPGMAGPTSARYVHVSLGSSSSSPSVSPPVKVITRPLSSVTSTSRIGMFPGLVTSNVITTGFPVVLALLDIPSRRARWRRDVEVGHDAETVRGVGVGDHLCSPGSEVRLR